MELFIVSVSTDRKNERLDILNEFYYPFPTNCWGLICLGYQDLRLQRCNPYSHLNTMVYRLTKW